MNRPPTPVPPPQGSASAERPPLRFDANGIGLDPGIRLLEASAGTGKTFALAHLVLRLVSEAEHRLSQILVVTFTEAAAAELRDRIGRRLQAGLALLEHPETSAADPVLDDWRLRCSSLDASAQERLRVQLLLALEELPAADITTIHGFCRRSLMREALAAGRAPQLQLEDADDPGLAEVVHAYWQHQVLLLPPHLLLGLRRCGLSPALLEDQLRTLDGDPSLQLSPLPEALPLERSLADSLPLLWQERWQRFLALWQREGRELQQELHVEAARWKEQGAGDTKPYRPTALKDRCALLDTWIDGQPPEGDYAAVLGEQLLTEHYHPGTFSRVARRAEGRSDAVVRLPRAPLMEAVAALVDGPYECAVLHALHWGRRALEQRRRRRGVSTFSMLLRDLDPGPDPAVASPLLEAVAGRYRAALIDEFQDTDPIQWRILSRAFGGGEHLLVMVGDPKQAIYRFRGGDLPTYLQAAASATEIHALDENRRSTPALIEALNRLMEPGLRRSHLPVPPVRSCADRLGPDGAPLQLLWLSEVEPAAEDQPAAASEPDRSPDQPAGEDTAVGAKQAVVAEQAGAAGAAAAGEKIRHPSRTALEQGLPVSIARTVQHLLQRGLTLGTTAQRRALQPADVCLLVSNHRQAELLRSALERCGIASRLVSKADVFTTPAATLLQRFLDALADPGAANRLRLLAASPLLAWSAARIATATPTDWGELAGRLTSMASQLSQRGLLGVLADLLQADGLARLEQAGRLAADLQQVSELVQEKLHTDRLAAAAAADWLRRRRLEPQKQVREQDQAHSDRADGAVSVITIHRSKGLQFPVVICPFLWQGASAMASRAPSRRWQPPGGDAPVLDLHRNLQWGPGYLAEAQRRRAEDSERERLAYVALTRAEHLLVLAWGPAQGQQSAPLLPWLFSDLSLAEEDEDPIAWASAAVWRQRLEQEIVGRQLPVTLLDAADLPLEGAGVAWPEAPGADLSTGPVPQRRLAQGWGRWSYSAWIRGHSPLSGATAGAEALEEGRDTADPTPESLLDDLPAATWGESGAGTPVLRPAGAAEQPAAARAAGAPAPVAASGHPGEPVVEGDPPGSASAPGLDSTLEPASTAAPASTADVDPLLAQIPREPGPLSGFPCGSLAGDCLHRMLEVFDFVQPATAERNRQAAERELQRSGLSPELLPALLAGLERLRTTPFGGELGSLALADLPPQRWLSELRFDLSLGQATAAGLADAFCRVPGGSFGAGYGERLRELTIHSRGFLTGAIDLVLPLVGADGQERWWVLDWKSNWLGERDASGAPRQCGPHDYPRQAMVELMIASHYPLQAHLYLVALHRYLRWRLPHYRPEQHLGGFLYVFLRGTPGPIPAAAGALAGSSVPGMLVERPPLPRLLALDQALGCTLAEDDG